MADAGGGYYPADEREAPDASEATLPMEERKRWRDALAAARAKQIERIRGYWKAARFPTFRDWMVRSPRHRVLEGRCGEWSNNGSCAPVFIDDEGVHCGVAHLMRESGWGEPAAAIARENVHVMVDEVTSGPLFEWILRSGLTHDEVTRVQPAYELVRIEYAREARKRQQRLIAHFRMVDRQLVENTSISLDIALTRLVPKIREGLEIAEIGSPPIRD